VDGMENAANNIASNVDCKKRFIMFSTFYRARINRGLVQIAKGGVLL
jgi:hypothetical protein